MIKLKNYGANPDEWDRSVALFGVSNLIPIAPFGEVSPSSKLSFRDIGKIPSIYNSAGKVVGFSNWSNYEATQADINKWKHVGYNIGLILGRDLGDGTAFCALDADTMNLEYQNAIYDLLIHSTRLSLPYRGRANSERRAYVFRAPVMTKHAHYLPEEDGKSAAVIECLAKGQQIVLYGQHPSQSRYQWMDNPLIGMPHDLTAKDIPLLTAGQFAELWWAIANVLPIVDSTMAHSTQKRDLSYINPSATDEVADWLDALDILPHLRTSWLRRGIPISG